MGDEIIAFTMDMDRCWMEHRFADLADYIASDVVMVAPGGKARIQGIEAAVQSYREFMSRCEVKRFRAYDHVVTQCGPAAVVEYNWDMAWSDHEAEHEASGREILMLAQRNGLWRVTWRTQLPA